MWGFILQLIRPFTRKIVIKLPSKLQFKKGIARFKNPNFVSMPTLDYIILGFVSL